jgi:hypothetical protein
MDTLGWLSDRFGEALTSAWWLLAGSVSAVLLAISIGRPAQAPLDRSSIAVAARGWLFPASLMVLGALLAPFDPSSSPVVLLAALALVLGIPLAQLVWSGRAILRTANHRSRVALMTTAQLCLTVFIFPIAMGLSTGFARTWR